MDVFLLPSHLRGGTVRCLHFAWGLIQDIPFLWSIQCRPWEQRKIISQRHRFPLGLFQG